MKSCSFHFKEGLANFTIEVCLIYGFRQRLVFGAKLVRLICGCDLYLSIYGNLLRQLQVVHWLVLPLAKLLVRLALQLCVFRI